MSQPSEQQYPITVCVLEGGPEYRIRIGSTVYLFEMLSYCGPMAINQDGSEKVLGPRHQFWRIVSLWFEQGERVKNGWAIWNSDKAWKAKKERERLAARPRAKVIKFKAR